jgi:cell division protein FtsI (penicillin-binding protein 3)
LFWFALLALVWAAAIFARLIYLQVVRRPFFEQRARMQQQRTIEVRASRGLILDRYGRELAVSVPVDSICAMPAEISDAASHARLLSQILGTNRAELEKKFARGRGFCWVARLVEPELVERVRALNLRGIYFQKESKRYYPKGATAAHIVGAVGLDQNGLAGLEQSLESKIQGHPGAMVVSTDARQRQFAGSVSQEPEAGLNVILTVDERIQFVAERELQEAIGRTGARAGTIVVSAPESGDLLAIASSPGFNPNEAVRARGSDSLARELERRRNYAASYSFEPGSTFKLVTISAALEEKVARPEEVIDCQMGSIVIAGHRIRDHKPFGHLTVEQVLQNSSGVGAIKLGMRLGDRRLYEYLRRFGFGSPTGVELPGEAAGLTKPAERWSKISIGAVSMGQEVGITALQLVQAVGAIANNGMLAPPHVVDSTFQAGEEPVRAAREPGRRVLSAETAIKMKRMMEKVVLSGTGKLAAVEGYTAGGKTGTAQKIDPRTRAYSKSDYIASFVGFAPLNRPAVVIAVILDSPRGLHSGGGVAAPVFARVAGEVLRYLQVPQEIPIDPALRRRRAHPDPTLLAAVTDFIPDNGLPIMDTVAGPSPSWPEPAPAPRVPQPQMVLASADASVPDFNGKPLRQVLQEAAASGFQIDPRGSGLARRQWPEAGSPAMAGTQVTVQFER